MEGTIFDIKHFAVHDGPGIRSTVFLKGCPLHCGWCHNPESMQKEIVSVEKEVMLDGRKFKTVVSIGERRSVRSVIEELEADGLFYEESGGGVTFSGGEPMQQIDFLEELLIQSKSRGWHTGVDTSGHSPWQNFQRILPYTDVFF